MPVYVRCYFAVAKEVAERSRDGHKRSPARELVSLVVCFYYFRLEVATKRAWNSRSSAPFFCFVFAFLSYKPALSSCPFFEYSIPPALFTLLSSRYEAPRRRRLLRLLEQHEIVCNYVADVEINDPVHQIEADEAHWEHDAGILVDVRRRDACLRERQGDVRISGVRDCRGKTIAYFSELPISRGAVFS